MRFRVIVSSAADSDVRQIVNWISERSGSGAETWHRRWVEIIGYLETYAAGCAVAPEDVFCDVEIRQVIFRTKRGRPYRALFTIDGDDVYVFRVRSPGQDTLPPGELNRPMSD